MDTTAVANQVRLDKIRGLPYNPKEHDIGEIATSIERFGFLDPIVINAVTGNLLGGHGRVDALRWLRVQGRKRPVGIEQDTDGMWLVPQYIVDVKEEDEGAAAVALNRLVERGGWDETRLLQVLDDIAARGKEALQGIGFDGDDLDRMRQKLLSGKNGRGELLNDGEQTVPEQYMVIIYCETENEQTQLIEDFTQRGLRVRALIS